jgi:hypothetical protein
MLIEVGLRQQFLEIGNEAQLLASEIAEATTLVLESVGLENGDSMG